MEIINNNKLADNYIFGIVLADKVFNIYQEDEKPVSIKMSKDSTIGGIEKDLAKLLPPMLKIVGIKLASEVLIAISEVMLENRDLGEMRSDFNLRFVDGGKSEYYLEGWY